MTEPRPQIEIYCFVSSKASAGAFIRLARTPERMGMAAVITNPTDAKRRILVPIIFPPAARFPAPMFCPSRIVVPIANELTKLVSVCMI